MATSNHGWIAALLCGVACCGQAQTTPLTGDWCGNRTCLAENGVTFDLDVAHFYHGVSSGGVEQRFRYGGHGDYVTNLDFGKLGVQEGAVPEAEGRAPLRRKRQ